MDIEDARDKLTQWLKQRPALGHLRVGKYGSSLLVRSGQGRDEHKHARLTHLSGSIWGLSFPHHTGRWDKTPFTGSLTDLLEMLVTDFSFYLQQP